MNCNNYNYTIWHQLYFHTQSTFLNLSLLLHSCTQSSAAVPQRSNSHDSHFCIIILNITPSCLPATHHNLEEAAISGCRPSDWCLPQAGQTGVNVIFSSLFLSPNYVTPSGKLDHCPVLLHPIKGFGGAGASCLPQDWSPLPLCPQFCPTSEVVASQVRRVVSLACPSVLILCFPAFSCCHFQSEFIISFHFRACSSPYLLLFSLPGKFYLGLVHLSQPVDCTFCILLFPLTMMN